MKAGFATVVMLLGAVAAADPGKDIRDVLDKVLWTAGPSTTSRFAFTTYGVSELGAADTASLAMNNVDATNKVIGLASTGTDAFVAADITASGDCGGDGNSCGKPIGWMHAVLLFEKTDEGWLPEVWHVADVVSAKEASKAVAPAAIARKVNGGADVAKVFESTLADPKAFANAVSDRKDVVLYGSESGERVVGGANVRAKLRAWNLVLTVRDGVQAGLARGKTLGWVAANVDAKPASKSKSSPTPYRLLAIYEKAGDSWKLVCASFSIYLGRS